MTREEAIAELSVLHERLSNPKDCEDGCYSWEDGQYVEAIDMAIEALQDDWVPVSERVPEEGEDVLVTVYFMGLKHTHPTGWNEHIKPAYYVDIASRIGEEWSSASDEYRIARNRHKTIAWKPLPEPFKESDTE